MEKKTYGYFILLLSNVFLFLVVAPVFGQSDQNEKDKTPAIVYPLYNGISVGVDIFGIGNKVLGGDYLSTEVSVEANFKNRFFPIAEIGYGTTNTTSDTGILYKGSSPYFKLGMNYNTMYKKDNKGYLYVGVRYAFSPLSFDVKSVGEDGNNPNQDDHIWKETLPGFDQKGLKANMHWFEFLLGVNVHIYKQLHMGWTIRMKYRLKKATNEHGNPWYVPGFGNYDSSRMGLTYSIIYKLPF